MHQTEMGGVAVVKTELRPHHVGIVDRLRY